MSEEEREILQCSVAQKQTHTAMQNTEKSTSAASSAPGLAAAPVSDGQEDPRKKISGLSHWAVRGNLTALEIKGRREGRISEEMLPLAGQVD